MQLIVQTAIIFFGTLMAAGLVALGEPPIFRADAASPVRPAVQEIAQALDSAWTHDANSSAITPAR
ncbi:MAG: hypothetical protein ABIR26_07750 [Ramlibacter sp.]